MWSSIKGMCNFFFKKSSTADRKRSFSGRERRSHDRRTRGGQPPTLPRDVPEGDAKPTPPPDWFRKKKLSLPMALSRWPTIVSPLSEEPAERAAMQPTKTERERRRRHCIVLEKKFGK
jgi:hypothetical protein